LKHSVNGNHPTNDPGELERQHFELVEELYRLRTLLKTRQGLPSGQIGHVRGRAKKLEEQIELLELAIGGEQVRQRNAQKGEAIAPRSKLFLEAFYRAAKMQLPAELLTQLEATARKGAA
jgi:hypothetical protein